MSLSEAPIHLERAAGFNKDELKAVVLVQSFEDNSKKKFRVPAMMWNRCSKRSWNSEKHAELTVPAKFSRM
jgi:hypothetical protein